MSFFPDNYNPEATQSGGANGNYFKPQDGKNKVRICSNAIFGYLYWTSQNKPMRSADHPGSNPPDIRTGDDGKPDRVKPFLAMIVWDYSDKLPKIWEITQRSIIQALEGFVADEDWGDPQGYDLTINRSGQKLETTYMLIPSNKKDTDPAIFAALDETPINLYALYSGDNPFDPNVVAEMPQAEDSAAWKTFEDLLKRAGDDADKIAKAKQWALDKMPMRAEEIEAAIAAAEIPF
jgi:hypothetical protein